MKKSEPKIPRRIEFPKKERHRDIRALMLSDDDREFMGKDVVRRCIKKAGYGPRLIDLNHGSMESALERQPSWRNTRIALAALEMVLEGKET